MAILSELFGECVDLGEHGHLDVLLTPGTGPDAVESALPADGADRPEGGAAAD